MCDLHMPCDEPTCSTGARNREIREARERHDCTGDLANLEPNKGDYADTWFCVQCAPKYERFAERPRFGTHIIVEMLRQRAVAIDAHKRVTAILGRS